MATVLTDNAHYTAIANAIRAKNGSSDTYTPSQMAAAIAAIPTGGMTSEMIACDYTNDTTLDFYRTKSGTPLYAELTSTADVDTYYEQSYWVKSGFFFWKADGTIDTEKSFFLYYENGMGDYPLRADVNEDSVMLTAPPSFSTMYTPPTYPAVFLPNTGDNPVQYTMTLYYT